uniref:Uncharacterized protein n=1 Tax=Oryza glaberrima TaxID=4538 RepID=I1R048_ORYGL
MSPVILSLLPHSLTLLLLLSLADLTASDYLDDNRPRGGRICTTGNLAASGSIAGDYGTGGPTAHNYRMGILTTEDLATSGSGAIADYWMGGSIDDDDNDNNSSNDS